eukprot:TRINITY_DN758_c0_g7_i1.p2 TRINITY_DN758_c0_g7~~TRINITY_DN758_c0_g7_i1.p2  ORF type:complete len:101 (+),score=5.81 TRINITY_DN758_c0_g7_i1:199-501(+)
MPPHPTARKRGPGTPCAERWRRTSQKLTPSKSFDCTLGPTGLWHLEVNKSNICRLPPQYIFFLNSTFFFPNPSFPSFALQCEQQGVLSLFTCFVKKVQNS